MGENKSNFSPLIRNECVSKALYTVYCIIAKYSFLKHFLYKANMCLVIYMWKRNCVIVVSGMRQWQIQDRGINLFPGEPRDTLRHCVTLFMSGHTFLHFISLSVLHIRGWRCRVQVQVECWTRSTGLLYVPVSEKSFFTCP